MQIHNLSAGRAVPDDIHVVIEIQAYGPGLKLELDKSSGALMLDRFLATPMVYPCNYGFIPQTLSLDGDPLDALVITPIPVPPGIVVRCRPVALLATEDDAGPDAKILCVPVSAVTPTYEQVQQLADLPRTTIQQIEHFFEHYKDLEPGRWMKLEGWRDAEEARKSILDSIARFDAEDASHR